jgi:uncharacterized protein (TIGR03435 family)
MLALHDGTRIEMRSESALSLERAQDGLSVRLWKGGVIVNAAKQHGGHLYVQTKDVTVSVVGTVFFVNAEESGSRVAVIEGEVQVHGGVATTLLAGEQVATNPAMPPIPVVQEIAWSRHVSEHLAQLQQSVPLLQQSTLGSTEVPPQNVADSHERFEVASVRAADPAGGGRGQPGSGASTGPCVGGGPQIDPGRFAINGKTLYYLITAAYGMGSCLATFDRLSGGPGWIKSDLWFIQAAIPEGSPGYTVQQFNRGEAPNLQGMLQALLADRFKLALHRETKDVPVYALTVAKAGPKVRFWREGEPSPAPGAGNSPSFMAAPGYIEGSRASMADLARALSMVAGRTVLDRTGLTGEFNYSFQFAPLNGGFLQAPPTADTSFRPSLFTVLEEQLGLKLDSSRGPVEVFVIDHVEKPLEN